MAQTDRSPIPTKSAGNVISAIALIAFFALALVLLYQTCFTPNERLQEYFGTRAGVQRVFDT